MLFRLAIIFSIVLLVLLIASVDFGQILDVVTKIHPLYIGYALLALLIEILLKSWRLQIMTKIFAPLSFSNSLKVFLIGRPFGVVTPGQVGDLVRTYSLAKETGLKKSESLAISFLDKAFDLFFLLVLASLGLIAALFLLSNGAIEIYYFLIALILVTVILIILIAKKDWIRFLLKPLFKLLVPKRYHPGLKNSFESFYEIFKTIFKNKKFVLFFLISLIIWPIVAVRVYFLAQSLGLAVRLVYFLAFVPAVALIEMVPISIMGIGPREYAYILFLSLININKEESLTLSLLTLITNGIPVALIGYYFIVKEQLSLKAGKINKIE